MWLVECAVRDPFGTPDRRSCFRTSGPLEPGAPLLSPLVIARIVADSAPVLQYRAESYGTMVVVSRSAVTSGLPPDGPFASKTASQ